MSEIQKRIKPPSPPDGWEQIATAVREVRDQIRESFGPQQEVRPLGILTDQGEDPLTVKAKAHHALKARVRDDLLTLCGFEEGAETAGGSAENDLAHERADAVMTFLGLAARHSLPGKLLGKLLLPRGEPTEDWLPPGTPVKIFGQHAAVVVDEPHRVLVNMAGYPHPVSFPRSAVAKEGELWTPPKHTAG